VKASFEKLENPSEDYNLNNAEFSEIRTHATSVRVYKEARNVICNLNLANGNEKEISTSTADREESASINTETSDFVEAKHVKSTQVIEILITIYKNRIYDCCA